MGARTLHELRAERDRQEAEQARSDKLARFIAYRRNYLPRQIEAQRLKLQHLEREAERLGVAI